MKKRMRRKMNKVLSLSLALVLAFSLIGCGSATNSVAGGDVVESTETVEGTESKMVPNGNDATTTVESDKESATETEIKDGEVAATDKPTETPAPTASPEPAAIPEPTQNPQPTPEPTSSHVHDYAESITEQPSCAEEGIKTLTCTCGDVKTESIPATGQHNWIEEMQIVTIPSTGHFEEMQVQVGTTRRTEYECAYCGARFDTPEAEEEHCIATGDFDHAFARTFAWDYDEPIYETQSTWVVDTPETTATVGTGRFTCSVCGATK